MKIVVLTGAGISADSGIATFRDANGLWANYRIEDVCTPEALIRNRELVLSFYDARRKELLSTQPNAAHYALKQLEEKFDVEIITQNIDDLHERAGSSHILHLHGELMKLRSSKNETATVPISSWHQDREARHADGSLLRPHVVFFGEGVPNLEAAISESQKADLFMIIGTSMQVYPAASLIHYINRNTPIWLIDPSEVNLSGVQNPVTHIKKRAADGVPEAVSKLIEKYS